MPHNASTLLDLNLERGRGERVALLVDGGASLSYAELHACTARVATRLRELGVRREQRVAMMLDDTPAFAITFLAAMRIGAVPIPTNFGTRVEDLGYILDDSYASVAVVDAALLPTVRPLFEARPQVHLVVANGDADPGASSLDAWTAEGDDELDALDVHAEDMAFWLYSSGSTGKPKGVVHTHANLWFTAENYAAHVLGCNEADVHLSTTKSFHAYGLGNSLTFPLWSGAKVVLLPGRPAADRSLAAIDRHHPTLLFSVPTLYARMLADPAIATTDFSSVRHGVSAAEPLPPELWSRFRETTGVEILDGIGSTEMLHIYCSNRAGAVVPGSSGHAVPGYRLELRDEHGVAQPPGGAGELCVEGGSMLAYYWHQQGKSRRSLKGEWFATGDRYHLGDDGSFTYEGRIDDMMKIGGLWVSPIEIENRLMEHASVREAAVVGVHVEGLLRIKAFVIAEGEVDDGLPDTLRSWCREALKRHAFPHVVELVDDFPRTSTGKVQRFLLRDRSAT